MAWKVARGGRQVGTRVAFVLYFTDQNASFVKLGVGLAVICGSGCASPMCVLYYFLHIRMLLSVASPACLFGLWRRSLCIDRLAIGWQRLYGVSLILSGAWCVVFGPLEARERGPDVGLSGSEDVRPFLACGMC